jgi:biopolymer transport protein ExbB
VLELFLLGGWVMYPILACSVLSWAVIVERCWYFLRTKSSVRQETGERFVHLAETARTLGGDAETREKALRLAAEPYLRADDRGLNLLAAVATISPLLGLFGTVLGMIELFRAMAATGAHPQFSDVVGGIWTALLTTAAGLAAAIPAQAAHHWFDHTADQRARLLQEYSGRLELA